MKLRTWFLLPAWLTMAVLFAALVVIVLAYSFLTRGVFGGIELPWTTESYQAFSQTKPGVGLVLDRGESAPKQLAVRSSTPGFTAEIRSGDSAEGPFDAVVSPAQTVDAETAFPLGDDAGRYLVLWITELPSGRARIEEITASS